jgi:type I restriction enzyme S subunit
MNDSLTETHWKSVHKALADIPEIERAVLFGSRAMGTFSPTSDVDMVLYGDSLTLQQELKLTAVLNEIDPLLEFDVLRFKTITSTALLEHIEKYGVVVYETKNHNDADIERCTLRESSNPSAKQGILVDWKLYRLDEICEGIFDCPHSTPEISQFGPLMVRSQDIRSGVFRYEKAACVSEETYTERTRRAEPRQGDLFFSREGTYFGIAAEVPSGKKICLGQRMVLLRPAGNMVNYRYLRFWLNSPGLTSHVNGCRDGSVAERLNLPTIRALPVKLPPLPEQRAIAHILGTLDDKIELNRKMNETLEAITCAIFKSWFVDFDPVRDKMEGRTPVGMDAETATLFPDSFEDSELGEIPRGWKVGKIADVARINENNIKKDYSHRDIEYIDISSVSVGELQGTSQYCFKDAPSRARRLVNDGDTIWSMVRPNRKSYLFMHNPKDNTVVSTGFAVISSKNESPSFLYAWVTTEDFVDYLTNNADGSAYPAVLPAIFEDALIIQPEKIILNIFEEKVRVLRGKIANNELQSRTLAQLRDTLLPKLLSGELEIQDTE